MPTGNKVELKFYSGCNTESNRSLYTLLIHLRVNIIIITLVEIFRMLFR